MRRQLARAFRRQDWLALVVELVVVIVGLVAAFQVDRWWEARGDRANEAAYIERLITDVEQDIPALEYAASLAETRRDFADRVAAVAADPSVALQEPAVFLAAVTQAAYTYTPALASHTFEDLRATGNLNLVRSADLKHALYEYYGYDENQRQFMNLLHMVEFRYFELSAHVFTLEQYRFVHDERLVINESRLPEFRQLRPDEAEVAAAAARLAASADLRAWLPKVRGMQVEQAMINTARLERARALLDELKSYQAGL